MSAQWTAAELDIVETLTRRVRLMSAEQLADARSCGPPPERGLDSSLRRLQAADLLRRTIVAAHPRLALDGPLVAWRPGEASPNFTRVRTSIRGRWHRPAASTETYSATPRAANLFGSAARGLPDRLHFDHDLLLAEVYVFYRRRRSAWAQRWVGEDVFPKAGYRVKDPDAFLIGDDGRPVCVVESAGRYGLRQLIAFHEHCDACDLPYELW